MDKHRFETLDGLRGVCACVVAAVHFWATGPVSASAFLRNGWVFVDFFFALSGFVIAWNYGGALRSRAQIARFAVLRFGRLYPLHFAVLFALVALELLAYAGYPYLLNHEPFNPSTSGPALVASLFLVQGLAGPTQAWNGPSWSISLEVWVYAGFVAAVASGRPRAVGAVVAVVTALLAAGVLDLGEAAKSVAPYLLCFVLGCLASSLFSRFGNAFRPRRWFATLLETAMVGAIIAGTIWCPRSLAPAFAVAVFLFACERGLVSRVLRWRPFVILGLLSYSIYMVHWLVLDFAWIGTNLLRSRGLDLWGYGTLDGIRTQLYGRDAVEGTAMLLCFLAATFAFGALTYRFIEAPGRRWARRHANAIAPQAVPAEAVARS